MAEPIQKQQFQHALQEAVKAGMRPEDRAPHADTIEKYVGQLETDAAATAQVVEGLRTQVLDLEQRPSKDELERVSGELKLAQERAEQTARAHEETLQKLRAELEEAQTESSGETVPIARFNEAQRRVEALEKEIAELTPQLEKASGEENPRVVKLNEQIAELERAQEEIGRKHQEAVRALEEQVVELQRVIKEDHPREVQEITRRADGEAENVRLLQLQMKGNQAAAMEVARLPRDQAAAKLEEARSAHGAIEEDTPENNVQKAVLTYKIGLLEAKQAEYLAIQEALVAERRAGAEEALRSPDVAVVGEIIKALTELHRTTEEALVAAREEHRVLDQVAEPELRNEPGIELALNKVRSLESQVASLGTSIETYQKSGANQILPDVQLLQNLISLVPEASRGEVVPYLMHAVAAIAAIQQTLTPEFGAEGVHHSRIEGLLKQIYTWNQEYLGIMDGSINAMRGLIPVDGLMGYLRYELPNVVQTIVGYTQMPAVNIEGEIETKRAAIVRLDADFGPLDAVRDHSRDERAIGANRAQAAIENIYLNTLLAIQGVHQPLHDAKADLERQKTVLGTMQRLIVGFFSMLFSIPRAMLEGLQTMGHPLVSKK